MLTRAFFLMKNLVFCILHINNDWFTNQGFKKYLPLAKSLTLKTKVVKRNACCIPQSLIPTETQSTFLLKLCYTFQKIESELLAVSWLYDERKGTVISLRKIKNFESSKFESMSVACICWHFIFRVTFTLITSYS